MEIGIKLPAALVDLFHSGAGGYRAQYYEGAATGERANRYVIHALQELFDLKSDVARKSIEYEASKIWIREGSWRDDMPEDDRNLSVKRWQDFAEQHRRIILSLSFQPIWAVLTPSRETHLEIKGAWIHRTTFEAMDIKPDRGPTLHNWGFT